MFDFFKKASGMMWPYQTFVSSVLDGIHADKKTYDILRQTDIAILVVDGTKGLQKADKNLLKLFQDKSIPFIIAYNKSDLLSEQTKLFYVKDENSVLLSAKNNENITEFKNKPIKKIAIAQYSTKPNKVRLVFYADKMNDLKNIRLIVY